VLGEGPVHARVVLIGEQPGSEEDIQGRPFVGPAGQLLRRALIDAGIELDHAYLTNAVKHFKFEERGKRRIHKKPRTTEVGACRPWLEAEILLIKPSVIVCLGATAARAILGPAYRLTQEHGKFLAHEWAPHVTSTVHPSAILRTPDRQQRQVIYVQLVTDLQRVADILEAPGLAQHGWFQSHSG
jgi:uracil-DNA glycosylase family protein